MAVAWPAGSGDGRSAKLLFTNYRTTPIGPTIEPWARHDPIAPMAIVEFEFNDAPAGELQIIAEENGDILLVINTERLKVRINSEVRDFGRGARAPAIAPLTRW